MNTGVRQFDEIIEFIKGQDVLIKALDHERGHTEIATKDGYREIIYTNEHNLTIQLRCYPESGAAE